MSRVEDATNNTEGFKDVSSAVGTEEYSYDANGNMINDANKGITNIQYNYLNLPQQVTLNDNTKIHYIYDAAGIKHRKTVDDGSQETTTYVNGFHYKDNTMQFLQHTEGRTLYNNGTWSYEYNLTDHLGNVRVSVNESGNVLQRDGYYPFGLTFNSSANSPENLYKYNGFEEQKETGWYDYLARQYDPELGRFTSIDPAADLMRRQGPYNYAFDNPIRFIDPDGMIPLETGKGPCGDKPCPEEQENKDDQQQENIDWYDNSIPLMDRLNDQADQSDYLPDFLVGQLGILFDELLYQSQQGKGDTQPGGTTVVGTQGPDPTKYIATEGADETEQPYTGVAQRFSNPGSVGKSLAEAGWRIDFFMLETPVDPANELGPITSGNSVSTPQNDERVLIGTRSGFEIGGVNVIDSTFRVGNSDSTYTERTRLIGSGSSTVKDKFVLSKP